MSSKKLNDKSLHEINFVGVVDSTSSKDVDISLLVRIQSVTKLEGSFSHDAPSDADYYGYEELEMEVESGEYISTVGTEWCLTKQELDEVTEKYEDLIMERLWEIVEEQAEKDYQEVFDELCDSAAKL